MGAQLQEVPKGSPKGEQAFPRVFHPIPESTNQFTSYRLETNT